MAIPICICASWFLNCGGLLGLGSIISADEQIDEAPPAPYATTSDKNTTTRPPLETPESLFQYRAVAKTSLVPKGFVYNVSDGEVEEHDKDTTWYDQSPTVQALKEAISESLSPEEKMHWYETPSFHPFPSQLECPSPRKFENEAGQTTNFTPFTETKEKNIKEKLRKMSSTIQNIFMPWIEKRGFHPDLILHGCKLAGLCIGIFDGMLHFWAPQTVSQSSPNSKVRILAEHLESVMEEFHKQEVEIPDVIFPYSVRSIPPNHFSRQCAQYSAVPNHLQNRYDTLPVAGIAMDPSVHSGIALMPNMYFGNLQAWDRYTKQFMDGGNADIPWTKRKKRVFWRGKIRKKLDANIPRLKALQVAARDAKRSPRRLDIALTSGCVYRKQFANTATQTSSEAQTWLSKSYFLKNTKCGGFTRTPHAKFANYWAHLNLPGSSLGSYSKNLQNLWPMGAAVMIWNQSAVEFYYDTLKTGVTHLWVNETTIEPMAAKLFANNGKLAQLMGAVGREWFEETLTKNALLEYYRQWFDSWAALQRFTPTLNMLVDPCTCAGWNDTGKDNFNEIKRCTYCASYPFDVESGCLQMMGMVKSRTSLCK